MVVLIFFILFCEVLLGILIYNAVRKKLSSFNNNYLKPFATAYKEAYKQAKMEAENEKA